uniref:Uncharacterized protein n=1 Tax=viral metagenome TaxID=1070528 RepID=A0A6M3KTD7_9ZZZZ
MTTLAGAILDLSEVLQDTVTGAATAGEATTLTDSHRSEGSGYFTNGTIWFLSGTYAGSSRQITAWDATLKKFTFDALAGAIVADVLYAAAPKDYPRWRMIRAINQALEELGDLPEYDVSLVTVANQEAYDLPAGVRNVLRVEEATATAAPYEYMTRKCWHEIDGTIYFEMGRWPTSTDMIIRLTYRGDHAELSADTGEVNANVHDEVLKYHAAVYALRWKRNRTEGEDKHLDGELAMAVGQAATALARHPIEPVIPRRDVPLSNW